MREAIESPLETRIAAQPPLLVEVQPEEEADPEANHNPQPRENQVKLGSVRVHDFKSRLNAPTLAERSCGVLIDKNSGAIDLSNSWRDSIPGFGIFRRAKAALDYHALLESLHSLRPCIGTMTGLWGRHLFGVPPSGGPDRLKPGLRTGGS